MNQRTTFPTHFTLGVLFLFLAMGSAVHSLAGEVGTGGEPLYRNGGHFGLAGSDTQLEGDGPDATPTNSEPEPVQAAYIGTLYRNGGHFGEANSDQSLEREQR